MMKNGEGGVKNFKKLMTYFMNGPLFVLRFPHNNLILIHGTKVSRCTLGRTPRKMKTNMVKKYHKFCLDIYYQIFGNMDPILGQKMGPKLLR